MSEDLDDLDLNSLTRLTLIRNDYVNPADYPMVNRDDSDLIPLPNNNTPNVTIPTSRKVKSYSRGRGGSYKRKTRRNKRKYSKKRYKKIVSKNHNR